MVSRARLESRSSWGRQCCFEKKDTSKSKRLGQVNHCKWVKSMQIKSRSETFGHEIERIESEFDLGSKKQKSKAKVETLTLIPISKC
jgi:hypothetical protein